MDMAVEEWHMVQKKLVCLQLKISMQLKFSMFKQSLNSRQMTCLVLVQVCIEKCVWNEEQIYCTLCCIMFPLSFLTIGGDWRSNKSKDKLMKMQEHALFWHNLRMKKSSYYSKSNHRWQHLAFLHLLIKLVVVNFSLACFVVCWVSLAPFMWQKQSLLWLWWCFCYLPLQC